MKLKLITPRQATKALVKLRPLRSEMDTFKRNLIELLEKVNEKEYEENQKNNVRDFLRETYYKDTHEVNTKGRKDLVIHLGKSPKDKVGVIIEAKRPTNKGEMLSEAKPNTKALHELVLYYMNERFGDDENIDIKYCIATNVYEWFLFDASFFERNFARDTGFRKEYQDWKKGDKAMGDNTMFYDNIVKRHLEKIGGEIPVVYFDIRDYKRELYNADNKDDKKLIELYRLLSPYHLLRVSAVDSNALNDKFYKELLHIIGLEERKENGKIIINRKAEGKRDAGSIIENTLTLLKRIDPIRRVENPAQYGNKPDDQLFNIAIELSLTWVNRILFLKLLEGQLVNYHQGDQSYRFVDAKNIHDYDELAELFHDVLAVDYSERNETAAQKYSHVPYLNSSLFDISDLELATIRIDALKNNVSISLPSNSVLRNKNTDTENLPSLEYLLRFLEAYDFGSDSKEEAIQEDNKTLINASVLGKVFEKINGYKDGSIYTPGFITTYMCRQVIRPAVVQKFNEENNWNAETFDDLKNHIADYRSTKDILRFNSTINSLHICDPAVGSGHFLVSALNELIIIKAELGIFADAKGLRFPEFDLSLGNDEIIITDRQDKPVVYHVKNGKPTNREIQRLQCALFHEKQNLIENCLFGVDINANSVKICRLRLWIELLKNAYYREDTNYTELETLPNIDINIKSGNSLISRFKLDEDLSKALKSIKYSINDYRNFVNDYKNADDKELKLGLLTIIKDIKSNLKTTIGRQSKEQRELDKASNMLFEKYQSQHLFAQKLTTAQQKEKAKLEKLVESKQKVVDNIKNNVIYQNAFEWRFEFPEVLDNEGNFEGFDVILGNPPYIQLQKLGEASDILQQQGYETFAKSGDIYQLFYEQGVNLLKDKGYLGFITSNKWMRTDYGSGSRTFLATKCKTLLVVDFGMAQIFESATTYTNILVLTKTSPGDTITMCRMKEDYNNSILLEDYVDFASVQIENPIGKSWISYDKAEYKLIEKIIAQGKQLKDWDIRINRGILTGLNAAFIVDTEIRDRLVAENPNSAEIIKPILRGEDIKAYLPAWADMWVIGTFPSLDIDIKQYPAIEKYLSNFKERLTPKPKGYNDEKEGKWRGRKNGSYKWFETQDSISYYEDFLKPKIIYPNMTKFMPFVYDKHQFFTNQKCFIITGKWLGYLTAFLNSKIFRFAFKEYFPELLGDTRELSKIFFETVTVKMMDDDINQEFEKIVDLIQENKKNGQPTHHLEQEIEARLCEIYSLSADDISLINASEGASSIVFENINARSASEIL